MGMHKMAGVQVMCKIQVMNEASGYKWMMVPLHLNCYHLHSGDVPLPMVIVGKLLPDFIVLIC
jgi:hypothetical protein